MGIDAVRGGKSPAPERKSAPRRGKLLLRRACQDFRVRGAQAPPGFMQWIRWRAAAPSRRPASSSGTTTRRAASKQQSTSGCQATAATAATTVHDPGMKQAGTNRTGGFRREAVVNSFEAPSTGHPVASFRTGSQLPSAASAERPLSDDAIGCSRPVAALRPVGFGARYLTFARIGGEK